MDNPYQSPPAMATATDSNGQRPRLLTMMGSGLLGGILMGGTFGAAGATLLGLVMLLLQARSSPVSPLAVPTIERLVAAVFVFAISGGILGIMLGCFVGPAVGLFARLIDPRHYRMLYVGSIVVSSAVGAVCGGASAASVTTTVEPFGIGLWALVGALIGGVSGAWAGTNLARGLSRLAWRRRNEHPKHISINSGNS